MNTELQKSLQVTGMVGSLDGYMLVVLGIMVATGILGGVANYFLSDRQAAASHRDMIRYALLGVVAALTVPLFLNMISSNLLEAARTRPVDIFVFGGFCLIYVVALRRVFENAAQRLLAQIDQVRRDVSRIEADQSEARTPARDEAVILSAEAASRAEPAKESLSYNDIEILRAIAEENYVYGNLAGLTDETGLARDLVSNRLIVLKNQGVIETRISDKNVLHWYLSPKGKQMLGEILSQGERRSA